MPATLKVRPWALTIDGLCAKPGTYDVDQIIKANRLEERVYRLRCVEAWSMVIPWVGIPLADVLKRAEPTRRRQVRRHADPARPDADAGPAPGRSSTGPTSRACAWTRRCIRWRFSRVGLYGEVLPNQNGAPIRLVVPWKYGFKSIKSIVRISFVETMPPTSWNLEAPHEYGFYANVNPDGRSSALEPEAGAAHRRVLPPRHAAVQRLRRSGGEPLRRHGPDEVVLARSQVRPSAAARPARRRRRPTTGAGASAGRSRDRLIRFVLKPAVFVLCLMPLGWLGWAAATGGLGVNPIEAVNRFLGDWALRFLLISLAVSPAEGDLRLAAADALPPHAGAVRLLLRHPAPLELDRPRPVLRLAAHLGGHRQAAVHHHRHGWRSCCWCRSPPPRPPAMIKRLGAKRWKRLHMLVYPAAALGLSPLLHDGQGGRARAADLRRRARGAARLARPRPAGRRCGRPLTPAVPRPGEGTGGGERVTATRSISAIAAAGARTLAPSIM